MLEAKNFIYTINQKFALGSINHVPIIDRSFYIVDNRPSSDNVIPHTPMSLLPLLSKINEQWTSDFETPQAEYVNLLTSTTEKVIHFFKIKYIIFLHCPFFI